MKIAVIGASGNVGAFIVTELANRGHAITAIARSVDKIVAQPHVTATRGDVADPGSMAPLLSGHDAVVSSIHFLDFDPLGLIAMVKASKVGRYVVVGGAGSLEVAPGVRLVSTPDFPSEYKAEAEKGAAYLDLLAGEKELDWTFLSPSALLVPGERTGKFRLGTDQLLIAKDGKSWISCQDFAVALADEIERPAHNRRRFTVGY